MLEINLPHCEIEVGVWRFAERLLEEIPGTTAKIATMVVLLLLWLSLKQLKEALW